MTLLGKNSLFTCAIGEVIFNMVSRKEYIVERSIHDSKYLINTRQNYRDDKCLLYEINEMGSYIWNRIARETSVDKIANQILSDMNIQDVTFDEIKKDVNDYICLLAKEGFLEVHSGRNQRKFACTIARF